MRCSERPDLSVSDLPPWAVETDLTQAVLARECERTEEELSVDFLLQKMKRRFNKIFPRTPNMKSAGLREKLNIIPSPQETRNPNFKFKSLKRSFCKILKRNKSKEKKNENRFAKIWLTNPDGRTLKLYTFRKED